MRSIDLYIFRTTFGAFALVLMSLTGVIWITQALRGIDLMTSQGQTIIVFLGVTGLAIPLLILVIAPIAVVIAVAHNLNKLGTDSEIIVMNAAGMRPWQLFRPFLIVSIVVSALVLFISAFLAPDGLRRLRHWDMEITADVVTNIIQPGRFNSVEPGLTLHIKERKPGGQLSGIFVDDRRNPKEHINIVSERGSILKNNRGTFLILENGSLQRHEQGQRDPAIVVFDRYAFDMSKFTTKSQEIIYSVRERYLWELWLPNKDDPIFKLNPGQFRAEFHDRLLSPLYPIAFTIIAFAFLGAPRTTRQSRAASIVLAILVISSVRLAGFACTVLAARSAIAAPLQYTLLFAVSGVCYWVLLKGIIIEPPARWMEAINQWNERLLRRFAPA
jgi:lipopolysaccharide export system permease protein